MSAVWLRATAQLRGRVRVTVLLAVLVGLAGGIVLAAVAGARRTDAALPRFLARDQLGHAIIILPGAEQLTSSDPLRREVQAVAALPEVVAVTRVTEAIVADPSQAGPAGRPRTLGILPIDPGSSWVLGRPIMVAGRLPDERQAQEAVIDEELAARRHLGVGSIWRVGVYTRAQLQQAGSATPTPPAGPIVGLRIVGIVRHPPDLLPVITEQDNLYVNRGDLYLTPAYWRRYGPDLAGYGVPIMVALERGAADLPRLAADVRRQLGPDAVVNSVDPGVGVNAVSSLGVVPGLWRAIRLESGALLAFAALAAAAVLLLVGQTLGRQIFVESVEYPTLRALGMTGGQLVGVALVRAVIIGVGGAAVAVAAAVALSPLSPIGLARRAELHPGISADLAVLVPGALVMLALVAAGAAVVAWRASRTPATMLGVVEPVGTRRPSRTAGFLARAGFRPAAVTGVRFALEPGRGRTAVPVRAAILGAAAAVCALTVAMVVSASLARLTSTPAAYGWTWDVSVGNFASLPEVRRAARLLDANPAVDGYVGAVTDGLHLDGRIIQVMAIEHGKGAIPLQVLEGREPVGPDEIALGATTLRVLGKRVGDTVAVARGSGQPPKRMRVVGRLVLSSGSLDSTIAPGTGGVVDFEALRRLIPEDVPQVFLVRLDPAADRAWAVAELQGAFPGTVVRALPHPDIDNLRRVGYLPKLLAGLVALLALATVTHALVSSVRRRRRDLVILKTLGFLPRQVSASIAWQASTFAVAAGLVGLPLGLAIGRWAWRLVAYQLGVAPEPVISPLGVLAVAGGTLLTANLIAALPGWVAGRLRPALVLRSE